MKVWILLKGKEVNDGSGHYYEDIEQVFTDETKAEDRKRELEAAIPVHMNKRIWYSIEDHEVTP